MYVINYGATLCVKLSYLFLFSRKLKWNSFFCTSYYHQDNAADLRSRPQCFKVTDLESVTDAFKFCVKLYFCLNISSFFFFRLIFFNL